MRGYDARLDFAQRVDNFPRKCDKKFAKYPANESEENGQNESQMTAHFIFLLFEGFRELDSELQKLKHEKKLMEEKHKQVRKKNCYCEIF